MSAWRRGLVGDLSTAFNFAATPDASQPTSLLTMVPNRADPRVLAECIIQGTPGTLTAQTSPIVQDPPVPSENSTASQEQLPGPVQRPSGPVGSGSLAACIQPAPATAQSTTTPLPNTSAPAPYAALALGAAAGLLAWWGRRGLSQEQSPPY